MRFMRIAASVAAILIVFGMPAWAAVPGFASKHISLLEDRGLPMSQEDAIERITFRPFVPSPDYAMVALLPAFHGADKENPENRGIGYEYTSDGIIYVLREWPLMGATLDLYPSVPRVGSCTTGHLVMGTPLHPRSYAWTTATLAFALQPDIDPGDNPDVKALKKEWARLVKRGACR